MSSKKKILTEPGYRKKGKKGHSFLSLALISNILLVLCTCWFSYLDDRYNNKKEEFTSYRQNLDLIELQKREYYQLQVAQNEIVVLGNLAGRTGVLEDIDIKSLKETEKNLSSRIYDKALLTAKSTYALVEGYDNEVSDFETKFNGQNVNDLFAYANKHAKEIHQRLLKIAGEAADKLKFRDRVQYIQFVLSTISSILILLGTFYLYQYENKKDESTTKNN